MTPQEAKEALKIEQIQIEGKAVRVAKFFEGISVANEALEKQIPKKPILDTIFPSGVKWFRCPVCKKKSRTEQSIRSREKSSHKIKLNRPKLTMREVLQRLEAYNKEHKTHLSYGKFVELMEGGKLDE